MNKMVIYCQLDPWEYTEQTSKKFELKYNDFH